MPREPYFNFYPNDWLSDPVTTCSPLAERLWFRLLLVMHSCEPRGHLVMDGKPMDDALAAKRCGIAKVSQYRRLVSELERVRVFDRGDDGRIKSRRMIRDTMERQGWVERQRRSRNSKKAEKTENLQEDVTDMSRECHGDVTVDVTGLSRSRARASSSSSSSSPTEEQKELSAKAERDRPAGGSFERFWEAYPKRVKRADALKAFTKALTKTDVNTIIDAVERAKRSRQWTDQAGKYIPHPATWLNGEQWLDEPMIAPVVVLNTNMPGNLRSDDWEDAADEH